jgi:formylglycine-generating enzyme required for sulfatase activity
MEPAASDGGGFFSAIRYNDSIMKALILIPAFLSPFLLAPLSPVAAGAPPPLPPPAAQAEELTGIEFILVPGGEFTMGSEGHRAGEGPPHQVRVKSFLLGRTEVTQRQWMKVMETAPSHFKDCGDCPVEQVSWDDVGEYLRRAGALTGMELRLPTEAEWEYAGGGGAAHQQWPGTEKESDAGEYSWYSGSFAGKTRPVGLKNPNSFMLFDMGGNVAEWCADWYGEDYYGKSPADNPRGPETGTRRAVRGGSWLGSPYDTRVTHRSMRPPATRSRTIGFRVAADAP